MQYGGKIQEDWTESKITSDSISFCENVRLR